MFFHARKKNKNSFVTNYEFDCENLKRKSKKIQFPTYKVNNVPIFGI